MNNHEIISSEKAKDSYNSKDFIEFKKRITRLVDDLLKLRPKESFDVNSYSVDQDEKVEIELESDNVIVKFITVEPFTLEEIVRFLENFHKKYSSYSMPMLCETFLDSISFHTSQRSEDSYTSFKRQGFVSLEIQKSLMGTYSLKVKTSIERFDDHFESFITEILPIVFPERQIRPTYAAKTKADSEKDSAFHEGFTKNYSSWVTKNQEFFSLLGCQVVTEGTLSWDDLRGLDELKAQIMKNVIEPIKRDALYKKIASQVSSTPLNLLPKGVLFYGPPGVGKTWSLKVIASESKIPVVIMPFSAVLSKWYGESERILRSIFEKCNLADKLILMIDELDALARNRQDSHEATSRIVSILLSEIDGLSSKGNVLVLGSANNLSLIDKALLDRFDIKIEFKMPNPEALKEVFRYYAKHLSDEDVNMIVPRLEGFNFRKIAQFCKEVLREFVSSLDLSQLEAPEPPLPKADLYIKVLEELKKRQD